MTVLHSGCLRVALASLATVATLAPVAALALAACGGNVVSLGDDALPDDAGGAGASDSGGGRDAALGSGPRSTLGNAGATPSLPLDTCTGPAGAAVVVPDSASAKVAVEGIWLLCDSVSPFGTNDEVGIELLATGAWFKMYDQNGLLVRGDADGELGVFGVGDIATPASSFTLDLQVTGSVAVDDVTAVTTSPQRMTVGSATYAFYQDF